MCPSFDMSMRLLHYLPLLYFCKAFKSVSLKPEGLLQGGLEEVRGSSQCMLLSVNRVIYIVPANETRLTRRIDYGQNRAPGNK